MPPVPMDLCGMNWFNRREQFPLFGDPMDLCFAEMMKRVRVLAFLVSRALALHRRFAVDACWIHEKIIL